MYLKLLLVAHTTHASHKILCFEEFLHKIALFFKKLCFLDFLLIESVSRLIENAIKILVWIWSFQLLLNWFWINWRHFRSIKSSFRLIENRIESFLKPWVFTCSITFKLFQNTFLSLFDRSRLQIIVFIVLSFSLKFLQGFLSSKAGKTFLPLLFHLFSCFMHFRENVEPMKIWDFC